MYQSALTAILLFAISLLVACTTSPPSTEPIERETLKVDPELQASIRVRELLQERVPLDSESEDGFLKIQFYVDALEDTRLMWAVTWFDDRGLLVKNVTEAYQPVRILRNQSRFFSATAPNDDATSFQLHLRESRN